MDHLPEPDLFAIAALEIDTRGDHLQRLHHIFMNRWCAPARWGSLEIFEPRTVSSSVMISLGDRPGRVGPAPPAPNRDASHCGRNALQKSSTSQNTSTIRSNIIASITERRRLISKSLSVTI